MVKETKKSTETIDDLQRERDIANEKIRQMKRAEATNELAEVVHEVIDGFLTDKKSLKKVLDACYNYTAQHRALFGKNKGGFNQSGEWIDE